MASQPYAVAVGEDWAFVTEPAGFVAALRLRAGTVQLVRTVPVPGEPFGATVTDEGRACYWWPTTWAASKPSAPRR